MIPYKVQANLYWHRLAVQSVQIFSVRICISNRVFPVLFCSLWPLYKQFLVL